MRFGKDSFLSKMIIYLIILTFLCPNGVYAGGLADALSAQTQVGNIVRSAEVIYAGDRALRGALDAGVVDIETLIRNTAELEGDIRCLVFPGTDDPTQKAYYVFTTAGVYFRYTTAPSVSDEFQAVTGRYAEGIGEQEQVEINGSTFYREKYKFSGANLDFINRVLGEVHTKGEHVETGKLIDTLKGFNTRPVNGTEYDGLIRDAIEYYRHSYPEFGVTLQRLLDEQKVKIVEARDSEAGKFFIYLKAFRRMRYNFITSIDDTIYIPKALMDLFLKPDIFKSQLEEYLGKKTYRKLIGRKTGEEVRRWLKKSFIGGLTHEVYEVGEWTKDSRSYDRKAAHKTANAHERAVAGGSQFDNESAFDDITKFLLLKELGMKPNIFIFDVLRDRERKDVETLNLGLGFERHTLRDIDIKDVKAKLEMIFRETTSPGETYHMVVFRDRVIAFSKLKADGSEVIYNIYNEGVVVDKTGYTIDRMVKDYQYLLGRNKKPISERLVLTYEELRSPEIDGIFLAGGKGFSLSLMDGVEDVHVPPGMTISTTSYFLFIRSNPRLRELIDERLKNLDTMDDKARQVVAKEIQDAIKATPIPGDIKEEILLMYRHLNIIRELQGKQTPTAVAIRSSGIKEDMEISTWLPTTSGSQAGQADTYLNIKGEENVLEKTRADWASLFTDRAIGYRDDQVFLIFSSKIGTEDSTRRENYYELLSILRAHSYNDIADVLTNLRNPGTYNLLKAIDEILQDGSLVFASQSHLEMCRKALIEAREDFIHPLKLGIGVVLMQMVKSYLAGVGFNVNPATKYGAKTRALWHARHDERQHVHVDSDGNIVGTRPLLVSFEINYGYGETVVGGMVDPDKYVLGTTDGKNWFILEKKKGSKQVQMIDIEEAFMALSSRINRREIETLAQMLGRAVSYDEVSKYLESILGTYINIKYLKDRGDIDRETDPDRKRKAEKKAMEKIAKEIAGKIKEGETKENIIGLIRDKFHIAEKSGQFGIGIGMINELVDRLYQEVDNAKRESERGRQELERHFGSSDKAGDFIKLVREMWTNKKDETIGDRNSIFTHLSQDTVSFQNLSYLFRSLIDRKFTTLYLTSVNHQRGFTLTDSELHHVAGMIAKISDSYVDDRDVEFAIELDLNASERERVNIVNMLEVDGKDTGKVYSRLYNVQARPYTAPVADIDLVIDRTEVEEGFIEKNEIKPMATGTKGDNACAGFVYKFDPNIDIGSQAEDIKRMKRGELTEPEIASIRDAGLDPTRYISKDGEKPEESLPVILLLEEADPSHDPLMRLCNAVITLKGGETSHAAIFCREQGIPGIAGVGELDAGYGKWLVADANNGRIYDLDKPWLDYYSEHGRFPVKLVKFIFRPYLTPYEEGDTKIGWVMASEKTAQENSVVMLAPDAAGIALARAEFKGEEIGINVIAGYGYDLIQRIEGGELREDGLTPFQRDIVHKLWNHPWVIEEIKKKLEMEGYGSYTEFVRKKFYYFYNNLGFSLAPDQTNKSRAYDFAMDKVKGLIGSEIFSWPGLNPLVGLRGSSLEVKGVENGEGGYQDVLSFILESLIDADENTKNQGWFNVFVRTPRELKVLCDIIKKVGERRKRLPREIGIMIEIPSNAFYVGEFSRILLGFKKDCIAMGVPFEKVFFSFGTNDYSHLAGKGDRDDPRMKLKIQDPAAVDAIPEIKQKGYFYVADPGYLPLIDEGSEVMLQLMEAVVKVANEEHIATSLCGEAITQLLGRKNYAAAGKIMKLLDSFGISQSQKRLLAAMLRYDVMRMGERVTQTGEELFTVEEKRQETGAVKGEIVFVDKPEDLISDELKGLKGRELEKRLRYLKYNNPEKLSRVANRIVVITGRFGSIEEMEKAGISWDHLQYAKAIILDSSVSTDGWDLFSPDKGIVPLRVKGKATGISSRRQELEGKEATIDFVNGKVYRGYLNIEKVESDLKGIQVPSEEPKVGGVTAVREDANPVYETIRFNPLILLAYRDGGIDALKPKLIEAINQLIKEAEKIQGERNSRKREWLINEFKDRVRAGYKQEPEIVAFVLSVFSAEISPSAIEQFAGAYLEGLNDDIRTALGSNTVGQYIKEKFVEHIRSVVKGVGSDTLVIHTMTSLNCKKLASLRGGFLVEFINPNPDYGLLGAARALNDYWEINKIELEAFKEVRSEHKNLGLQITDLKGTQSGAVLYLMIQVLKGLGLVPGQDGLEVGVNISTPSDTLSVRRYIEESGITFVTIDRKRLGGAWLGADIEWEEEQLVTDAEIEEITRGPIWIVKQAVLDKGIKLLGLVTLETYRQAQGESHLLPLYLHREVKQRLGYTDERMAGISYTDSSGEIHIDREAVSVMGSVLNELLGWGIDQDAASSRVLELLQAHEELEKFIIDNEIDFNSLRKSLIRYLEGQGDSLINLLSSFLNNYPVYRKKPRMGDLTVKETQLAVLREMVVHQMIERKFFNQGVRLLPRGYTDAKRDRIEIPVKLGRLLEDYIDSYLKDSIDWAKLKYCCYITLPELIDGADTSNPDLVVELTKKGIEERLQYVNKNVPYVIVISKSDFDDNTALSWQLDTIKRMVPEIVRRTGSPITIALDLKDADSIRSAIVVLNTLSFSQTDRNIKLGLQIRGNRVNEDILGLGITTLVPVEEDVSKGAGRNFMLLLRDAMRQRGLNILVPYESYRRDVRTAETDTNVESYRRLYPDREIGIRHNVEEVLLRYFKLNQKVVVRFKVDAEKRKLQRGIVEPVTIINIRAYGTILIDGYHRIMAARELGWDRFPVSVIYANPRFDMEDSQGAISTVNQLGLRSLDNIDIIDVRTDILSRAPAPVSAPLAKVVREGEETSVSEIIIDSKGQMVWQGSTPEDPLLQRVMLRIRNNYGAGISKGVNRIRVVDNIRPAGDEKAGDLVPYSMIKIEGDERVLLLDRDALDNEQRLYLVLSHEFMEGFLTIVEPRDMALRELTGIYLTVKDALREGISDVGDISGLDEDNQFLKVVGQLKGRSDEEIIAAIIEFMRGMPYYKDLFRRFSFSGEWERRILAEIRETSNRYEAALRIFNSISDAKRVVSEVKVREERMVREQKDRGGIERDGLHEEYRAFGQLFSWYASSRGDMFIINTRQSKAISRRLSGGVVGENSLSARLIELLRAKGISSIAVSNGVVDEVRDSSVRLINIISDILLEAGETDFAGFAYMNELAVKVVSDASGKRIIITKATPRHIQAAARAIGASGREFPVPDDVVVEDQAGVMEQSFIRMGKVAGYVNSVVDKAGSFFYLLNNSQPKTQRAVYAFRFEDVIADVRAEEISEDSLWERIISGRANTAVAKTIYYLRRYNPQAVFVVYSDKAGLTKTRMEAALNAIDAGGVFSEVITGDEIAVARQTADKGTVVFATSRDVKGYRTVKVSRSTDTSHRNMVPFEEVVTVMTELLEVQPEGRLGDDQKERILKGYEIWLQQAGFTGDDLTIYLDELRRALNESSGLVVSLPIPPLPKAGSVIEELDREYLQKEISTYA